MNLDLLEKKVHELLMAEHGQNEEVATRLIEECEVSFMHSLVKRRLGMDEGEAAIEIAQELMENKETILSREPDLATKLAKQMREETGRGIESGFREAEDFVLPKPKKVKKKGELPI